MEIRKYLRLVMRWWWLLVVSVIIPMVASYYFASQQSELYQAKATIMVGTSLQNPNPDPRQMDLGNTLAAAYAELIKQGPFLEAVIERLGLGRTPAQLAAQITTWVYSGAQLLEIWVTDTNPEAAALIANALADELIRRSPTSGGSDPEQQEFIRAQLEEQQAKIGNINQQINDLTASLAELTSAAEIQDAQDRLAALEKVKSTYQTMYVNLLDFYSAESPNVLSLFEPAAVPQWPMPSKTQLVVAMAGAVGLGLALGAIFLMEYLDTSLRWEGGGVQSVLELPVLGTVPQVSKKKTLLSNNPLSPVAESVRALRANILLVRPGCPFKTLLLTSPGTLEGKSYVLANLAMVLASAGDRVIVVDADMRNPSLHQLFDRPNVTGLADVLSGQGVEGGDFLSVPLQETELDNLYLLSGGRPPRDPAALLTSPRFLNLLESLSSQADIVLIDSPPVLGPPDATILATLVEGTILVVSTRLTKHEWIQQAKGRLTAQQGVNLLGCVVNRVRPRRSDYDYRPAPESRRSKRKGRHGEMDWLTLSEAAERLGVSANQARRWCKTGRLSAVRHGLGWRVDRDGLERMLNTM